jgi:hypothetical protein
MEQQFNCVTKLDVRFEHGQKIDIDQLVNECSDKWFNETLTRVNDSVVDGQLLMIR